MKGVFFSHELPDTCELRDVEVPTPGKDEILVKNVAVASNPKDWKVPLWIPTWSGVEGNDIAGHVEAVGEGVTEFKKGDKVAAFTKMMTDTKYGCYQEYSVSPAHTAWHLAESTSFEEAATLPLAVMTAAIGLYVRLGLAPPPTSGERGSASGIVLINGAASSVGAFAVQLAKRSGYSVVGIAGQSGDYARSLGADEVVDYRSADTGKQVLAAIEKLGGKSKLVGTYDAVSTEKTVELLAYEVLQPEGGKITTVLPAHDNGEGLTVKNVVVERTMVGTAHSEDAQFAEQWYRQIGKWLDDGSFKANQVKLLPNGLDSVKEGVHLLKDGKVNAVKLVYRIADSTCLKQ